VRKGGLTDEQTIKVLKERAAGLWASELCRRHGVSDATFYKPRSRCGGMEVSLKAPTEENRKLKRLR
jgi:putative transposase